MSHDLLLLAPSLVLLVLVIVLIIRGRSPSSSADMLDELDAWRKAQDARNEEWERQVREAMTQNQQATVTTLGTYARTVADMQRQVTDSLSAMREENIRYLGAMQQNVDSQLRNSFAASSKQMTEQLGKVFEGIGEVKDITSGIDDLRRILGNVKNRGEIGELQAKGILDDILAPGQYAENVECKPRSGLRVEYAVRLPGEGDAPLWLPIDCKFPKEDYEKILDAETRGDNEALKKAREGLAARIRSEARDIRAKYICPPHTTDFGILFLPTEGLYAEALRLPGVADTAQRLFHVIVAGPTTLSAVLDSLAMGFRTLAVQKRSEEVWRILSDFRTEFSKFQDELSRARARSAQVEKSFEEIGIRCRRLDKTLVALETDSDQMSLAGSGRSEAP